MLFTLFFQFSDAFVVERMVRLGDYFLTWLGIARYVLAEVKNSELLGSDLCYTAMNFRKIGEAALNLEMPRGFKCFRSLRCNPLFRSYCSFFSTLHLLLFGTKID